MPVGHGPCRQHGLWSMGPSQAKKQGSLALPSNHLCLSFCRTASEIMGFILQYLLYCLELLYAEEPGQR